MAAHSLLATLGMKNLKLPNPQTDIKRWVEVTDEICKRRFDPSQPLPSDFHRGLSEAAFKEMETETVLQEMAGIRRIACANQLTLSRFATAVCANQGFEDKWINLRKEEQEDFLIAAFKDQEGTGGDQEHLPLHGPTKLNCPEIRMEVLLKDRGNGFLHLLKMFLLDNNDIPPTQPFILPNERFDEIIGWNKASGKPSTKARLNQRRLFRTLRIREC